MSRFEELESFVAVVEAGSITAASDRLSVAKSAVSRRLSSLEARLGVQLINRTTRVNDLTSSGRAFYQQATRLLSDLAEAESAVARSGGTLTGELRLALPLSFGVRHMAAPISDFLQANPEVTCEVDLNDRRVDLVADGVDLALRIGNLQDSSLIARKLFDASMTVCASPGYLARAGVPQHPSDLSAHAVLVYANVADPNTWEFTLPEAAPLFVPLTPRVSSSNGDLLTAMAEQGQGVIRQPTFMLEASLRRGSLVPLLEDFPLRTIPAHAIYPQTRHLSYRVRAFIDHLVDWFEGELPWDAARAAASTGSVY
ncbi:MAG: LysR family transcriptional regulator [Pseudomonadota bacterium]